MSVNFMSYYDLLFLLQEHNYQKPIELCAKLVKMFANPTTHFNLQDQETWSQSVEKDSCILPEVDDKSVISAKVERIRSEPWIIDAGCGSGSFSVAARLLGRCINVVAYDNDAKHTKTTRERLNVPLDTLRELARTEVMPPDQKQEEQHEQRLLTKKEKKRRAKDEKEQKRAEIKEGKRPVVEGTEKGKRNSKKEAKRKPESAELEEGQAQKKKRAKKVQMTENNDLSLE